MLLGVFTAGVPQGSKVSKEVNLFSEAITLQRCANPSFQLFSMPCSGITDLKAGKLLGEREWNTGKELSLHATIPPTILQPSIISPAARRFHLPL